MVFFADGSTFAAKKQRTMKKRLIILCGFLCLLIGSATTSVWTIAVGEPTLYGEIVASIVTVVLAAASILYYVTVCPAEVNCQAKYEECEQYYPEYAAQHSGGYGYSMCARCFEYCQFQNVWDCPRPI